MSIYFIVPTAIVLLGIPCLKASSSDKKKKRYLFTAFTLLFLVMALRGESVGTDNANYSLQYLLIGNSRDFMDIISSAPVYNLYNKLLYLVFPYRQAIVIANAFIICACTAVFIYHFSDNVVFSTLCFILMYFYLRSFNISRQYLSCALMLIAACKVDNRKLLPAIILSLLATGIHNLAIIFFPFLFLMHMKIKKEKILLISLACVIFTLAFSYIFPLVVNSFAKVFTRYQVYLGGGRHAFTDTGQGRNIILTIFYAVFLILDILFIFINDSSVMSGKKKLEKILIISMIGIVLGLAASQNLAVGRMRIYFSIYVICLLPNTIELFNKYKMPVYILSALILLVPFYIQLSDNISGVVPYKLFWQ